PCRGKEAVRTRTLQKCPTSPGGTGPLPLLVRLVPDQPIFLRALGWGDDDRFAGCFASAWRALPRVAREGIVRLWETHPSWGDLRGPFPIIELLPDWIRRSRVEEKGTIAVCAAGGHELRFWAPAVDRMPEGCVATLIAHELCHVLLRPHAPEGGTDEEHFVRKVVWAWGFDEEGLDEWLAVHRAELRQLDRQFWPACRLGGAGCALSS